MPSYHVLITGHTFRRVPGGHEQRLVDAGCELISSPYQRGATEEELIPLVRDVDAVLATTDAFTRRVFAAANRLKIVARFGVGYDAIDCDAAAEHGVWVTITPGTNELSVADHTLALILALARRLVPEVNATKAGDWARPIGTELGGLTLGLIGFGRIGRQVALRARAFGMALLVYDLFQDEQAAAEVGARYVPLDDLLAGADFVSLHAPATPQTHDLINAETLARMKPSAYLVNTARGELVNEADLAAALRAGQIAGAALDVFKQEPPPKDHPLLALPNVIATSHVAGITTQSAQRMAALAADNILAALRGERPPHPVNEPVLPGRPRA
jgi:D-3-phosphoglycerate dehydrogenase